MTTAFSPVSWSKLPIFLPVSVCSQALTDVRSFHLQVTVLHQQKNNQHMLIASYLSYTFKTAYKKYFLFILPITLLGHALDRLVSVSSIHYCTSTSDLSTLSSSRGLTTYVGISHLEGGFTLRCLQRLSRPGLATLPCIWYATDTPAASPSRSSRTKDSSSQISYAHAG